MSDLDAAAAAKRAALNEITNKGAMSGGYEKVCATTPRPSALIARPARRLARLCSSPQRLPPACALHHPSPALRLSMRPP